MSKSDKKRGSYGTILKSSSIIGGSQAFGYAIGLFRTKLVAILLGPSGVGLVGIYRSIITLTATISGMGLGSSGVREISAARGKDDHEEIGQVQLALRRLALLLGSTAFVGLFICSPWISDALFQDRKYELSIGLIGVVLILNGLKGTQGASIQGFRKIGDLAKITIIGSITSVVIAFGYYLPLGERGIVPAIITMSAVALSVSWWYARRLLIRPEDRSWRTTWGHSKRLLGLGAALAWGALLGEMVPFAARAMIVRDLGIEANGYYVAAWAISGLFINFLLSAMWADFFPRLVAVASDPEARNQIVNEQTEIGIIVALPGVLAITTLAPLVIRILYTADFAPAAALLPWFLLGLFGRITAWPMGMIILAKGDAKVQAIMQTISASIHLVLLYGMFQLFSLQGLAMAFALQYLWYNPALRVFLGRRYGFAWNSAVLRLLLVAVSFLLLVAVLSLVLPFLYYAIGCVLVVGLASLFSAFQLYLRVSTHPKLEKLVAKLPASLTRKLDALVARYE